MNFEDQLQRQERRDVAAFVGFATVFLLVGACLGALVTAVLS